MVVMRPTLTAHVPGVWFAHLDGVLIGTLYRVGDGPRPRWTARDPTGRAPVRQAESRSTAIDWLVMQTMPPPTPVGPPPDPTLQAITTAARRDPGAAALIAVGAIMEQATATARLRTTTSAPSAWRTIEQMVTWCRAVCSELVEVPAEVVGEGQAVVDEHPAASSGQGRDALAGHGPDRLALVSSA